MNIDGIINSKEYRCKLAEHLSSLLSRTRLCKNEASTAFVFQSEIYFFARDLFNIDLDFRQEESQSALRHRFIGRMDAVCNNLVIEYKRPSKLLSEKDKQKAEKQLSE
jgi:hypothetical protein